MKNPTRWCLAAALLLSVPACGGDDGGDVDARPPNPDASVSIDATNADAGSADARPDARPQYDAEPLVGIADARTAPDGTVNVSVPNVYVTYIKATIGGDVGGFYVQKEQTGPALFIAIDPTTLDPEPAVGDDVTFTITQMATEGLVRQATAISDLTVNSSGNELSGLVQDVTAAGDLVSAIGNYESELITASFTVMQPFTGAGSGFVFATIDTTGVTSDTNLRFRVPTAMQDALAMEVGCQLTVTGTPMWRYNASAQISAWQADEISGTCPTPTVVKAMAASETTVEVEFSHGIDASTIVDAATQFTITGGGGLTVSGASVAGPVVTLTTDSQTIDQLYTVTVADTVHDVFGAGIGSPNSADFWGFGTPEKVCDDGLDDDGNGWVDCLDTACAGDDACAWAEQLYLWEVDSDTLGTDDVEFIEVRNLASTAIDLEGYYVLGINGSDDLSYIAVALTGSLDPGALLLIGDPAVTGADITFPGADNQIQNGPDGVLLVHCPECTGVSDFPVDTDVGSDTTTFTVNDHTATKIDAVAYDTDDADDADLWAKLGVSVQYNENANTNKDLDSIQRTSVDGWAVILASPDATGVEP